MKKTGTGYVLLSPMYIDRGELEHISSTTAFVLGAEWRAIVKNLQTGKKFVTYVHYDNHDRISKLIAWWGRKFCSRIARQGKSIPVAYEYEIAAGHRKPVRHVSAGKPKSLKK